MEDRRKTTAAKSGPIDLLTKLTGASKRTAAAAAASAASTTGSGSTPQTPATAPPLDGDRRPLRTHPLTPPDYLIAPEVLMESFVELPVCFLGIIPNVSSSLDPHNRSEILRCLDNARRQGTLPHPPSAFHSSSTIDEAAIFSINVYHVKLSRYNANSAEELIVRVPTHEIASASYINDDGIHYLALKISATFGFDSMPAAAATATTHQQPQQQRQQQQAILARRNEEICDLVILHVEEKQKAEEICALVSQSFQLVYTEATMEFFDRQIRDGAGTSVSSSFSFSPGGIPSATSSVQSNHIVYDPSDSLSNFDVNSTSGSSQNGSGSVRPRSESDRSSILESRELIEDFTRRLQLKLNNAELNQFAQHLTQWFHSDFAIFCQRVADLFGVERKYMLAEMRPFIPEQDAPYFERFLRQKEVYDFGSPMFLRGVGMTESPSATWRNHLPEQNLPQTQSAALPMNHADEPATDTTLRFRRNDASSL